MYLMCQFLQENLLEEPTNVAQVEEETSKQTGEDKDSEAAEW